MPLGKPKLSRQEAIEIINSMPFLVATGQHNIPLPRPPESPLVVMLEFEVASGSRRYKFEKQPFSVLSRITREEYLEAAPWGCWGKFYYRLSTD